MNRRELLVTAILASTALSPARAAAKVQLIYVGGWDCPSCTVWKNKYKASWLASPEYKQVTFTQVDVPRLREAYKTEYWPGDLAPILAQLPAKHGTPRFLVVQDGRIISNHFGGSDVWLAVYADLKKALAQ